MDATTVITYSDDFAGSRDSYFRTILPNTGTFYLRTSDYNPTIGGPDYFYSLNLLGWSATRAPWGDDMERGVNGWRSTSAGLWHQVDATSLYSNSHSASHSWWYGRDATGNYDTGAANTGLLFSPPVYIPITGYYLRFWYWYQTETQGTTFDQRLMQIAVDGGPFTTVLQLYDDPMGRWLQSPAIDLSSYAGHTVEVGFRFTTRDENHNNYRGWYVDDVSITTTPPPSCTDIHEPNNAPDQATGIVYGQTIAA